MKNRPEIDGLRALAVFLVVLAHLGVSRFAGGFIGVDIFFVISGFLITSLITSEYLENSAAGRGWFSLRAFYFRRAKRILPMSILVLATTVGVATLCLNPIRATSIAVDGFWATLFLANFRFIQTSTDYSAAAFTASPLQHFWSLAVEEQFYFVLPALLLLAGILLNRLGKPSLWLTTVRWILGFVTVASLAYSVFLTMDAPQVAYFSSATRAYELGIGALLAVWTLRSKLVLSANWQNGLGLIGLGMIAVSVRWFTENDTFPGFIALLPTLGTALFIFANKSGHTGNLFGTIFAWRPIVFLGKISYSIYLWHWPIIVLMPQVLPDFAAWPYYNFAVVLLAVGLSVASYYLVENPFRRLVVPAVFRKPARFSLRGALAAAVSIVLFTGGVATASQLSPATAEGPNVVITGKPGSLSDKQSEKKLLATLHSQVLAGLALTSVPADLNPKLSELEAQRGVQWEACIKPVGTQPTCEFGNSKARNTAVILGDSYALAAYPMVINALDLKTWRIIGLNRSECMVADVQPWPRPGTAFDNECVKHRKWTFSYLAKLKPNLIVMADQPYHPIAEKGKESTLNKRQVWYDGMKRSLEQLKRLPSKLVYFGFPMPAKGLTDCVASDGALSKDCFGTPETFKSMYGKQILVTSTLAVPFIDPTAWLCSAGLCPPIIDKTPVFWDGSHLSVPFSAKLAPVFRAYLLARGLI